MFDNHLNDQTTYCLLSREEALDEAARIKDELENWINEYSETLGKEAVIFLLNHLHTCKEEFSFAYQLYKIHKTPMTTRAIISGSGSLLHPLGHWITEQLRPVTLTMPGYLESSYALKEEIVPLTLPPNARLFTCDCVAMYPSFPYVATEIVGDYLYTHHSEFKYNVDALVEGLTLLMENMIFRFGDLYYKQISGTAMGVRPAGDFANIFFGIHEKSFLPEFSNNLAAYRRFIDDIIGIWIPHPDPAIDNDCWNNFKATVNNYHGLKWVFVERSNSVNFDLWI